MPRVASVFLPSQIKALTASVHAACDAAISGQAIGRARLWRAGLGEDAAIPAFQTIKSRRDFLAVRGGIRASTTSFLIEAKRRPLLGSSETPDAGAARFGFTVTKKLGSAVRRNRIRRRLKAAVAELAASHGMPGFDYVVVARSAAFDRPYADLLADLNVALTRIRKPGAPNAGKPAPDRGAGGAKKPLT